LAREGERDDFDELALVLDEDAAVMNRERSHDILPFQLSPDEVFGAVELDPSVAVNLPDPRDMAVGDGERQMTAGIEIAVEGEVAREMAEARPETIAKDSGESSAVFGRSEASAGLLEVVIAKESVACPAKGPKIGADVEEDAFLPETIEALDSGVSPRFAGRDEPNVNAQQQMQPDDLGEAVSIAAPAGGRHLVVHLGDWKW